jgi:hypothetical protein
MKILMSPAMRDVFFALGYEGELPPRPNGGNTLFENFPFVAESKSLFLLNKKIADEMNVDRHKETENLSNLNIALVDIELRENKLHSFLSEGGARPKNIRTAIAFAFSGLNEVYNELTKNNDEQDWIVWSSVQPQIGDYEADVDDLKLINLPEVMQEKKAWWYGVDFSFSKYRDGVDGFLKNLLLEDNWGETLSPFHFLLVPNDFED